MLTGRRQFVRLIGMATAVGAAVPAALARTAGDRYINERLQLSIVRPPDWHFLSVVDFHAAAQHQRLAVDAPELVQLLREPENAPFLVITKFGAHYDDFNPCITCWDEPGEPGISGGLETHNAVLRGWGQFLSGVSVLETPRHVTLACTTVASRSVWRFHYEHDSGRTWAVKVRTTLVVRRGRVQTFHFMDAKAPRARAEAELEAACRSLSYGSA